MFSGYLGPDLRNQQYSSASSIRPGGGKIPAPGEAADVAGVAGAGTSEGASEAEVMTCYDHEMT
jgi:hypothetical protein